RMTVIRFSNLTATIPATPAHTARLGNSPVPPHPFTKGVGVPLSAAAFTVDFAVNLPLVLLERAIRPANPVALSVSVAPAGTPVLSSIERDTRPAPDGDHASVVALSPHPAPTLTQVVGSPLTATLLIDAVGSFHVRPFVDCNGNGRFEPLSVDREPFILM